jgi:hypothetical protein
MLQGNWSPHTAPHVGGMLAYSVIVTLYPKGTVHHTAPLVLSACSTVAHSLP